MLTVITMKAQNWSVNIKIGLKLPIRPTRPNNKDLGQTYLNGRVFPAQEARSGVGDRHRMHPLFAPKRRRISL